MSHHDKNLIAYAAGPRGRKRLFRMIMRGSREITFKPTIPDIKLGSVADDWRSVGYDLRSAMNSLEHCE
jgi:hypothetical protein